MIDWSSYLLFVLACIALILVPGPAQALVLAKTLSGGRKAGALSAVGLNIGTLVHTLAAALGISAILATSALAFSVVKYLGAAYLVWLGIRSLRARAPGATPAAALPSGSGSPLVQGVAAGVLNPKVALFFLAFLPQFVEPGDPAVHGKLLFLGLWFLLVSTLSTLPLILGASGVAAFLRARPKAMRWIDYVFAGVMGAFAVRLVTARL